MSLYLESTAVPSGTEFPGTVQGLLELLAQYIAVKGNESVIGVNYGSATPSADHRDKPWVKTTPGGKPVGIMTWNGIDWQQMDLAARVGTTADRPVSPAVGTQYFDTDIACALIFERSKWRTLHGSPGDVKLVAKATLSEALTLNPGWIELKDARGRVLGAAGAGVGLTERAYNDKVGHETHVLTTAEMPTHNHTVNLQSLNANADTGSGGLTTGNLDPEGTIPDVTSSNAGDGEEHNNMQPTLFLWCIVKE